MYKISHVTIFLYNFINLKKCTLSQDKIIFDLRIRKLFLN